MTPSTLPDYARIRRVKSFDELVTTPFADGVNALCWERALSGDFAEVIAQFGRGEAIIALDEARLLALRVSPAGRVAIDQMIADLKLLRDHELDPALNCIHGYCRDSARGPVPTDVFSFHADSATIEASTWLCTYHGSPTEGLPNEQALRRIDVPETRAELLKLYGRPDEAGFRDFLHEHCYDLHYATAPHARPFSFGVGHLWRIAIDHPGCPVPPCIHRAPVTLHGQPRLLLIS